MAGTMQGSSLSPTPVQNRNGKSESSLGGRLLSRMVCCNQRKGEEGRRLRTAQVDLGHFHVGLGSPILSAKDRHLSRTAMVTSHFVGGTIEACHASDSLQIIQSFNKHSYARHCCSSEKSLSCHLLSSGNESPASKQLNPGV
jgi:hypothetical protein